MESNVIICGDCIEVMKGLPESSIDTVITDPPYGLGFMGKEWDTFKVGYRADNWPGYDKQPKTTACMHAGKYDFSRNAEFQEWFTVWSKEVLRVCKPGAIMLVFGGTRTYHRLTCAIEDAGWEIRDCMMYLYGSGFPKSLDISKAIDKAAGAERKQIKERKIDLYGNYEQKKNLEAPADSIYSQGKNKLPPKVAITAPATDLAKLWSGWGTALKPGWEPIVVAMKPLDGTFAHNAEKWGVGGLNIDGGRIGTDLITQHGRKETWSQSMSGKNYAQESGTNPHQGRWPANVILDEESGEMLDAQSGIDKDRPAKRALSGEGSGDKHQGMFVGSIARTGYKTSGGASRFFYCAKASRKERGKNNNHPTVKPLALMEYLCKLTMTPTGGVVLDPFGGSGTTAVACQNTGRDYLIIEKDPHYCEIARARVAKGIGQMAMFG